MTDEPVTDEPVTGAEMAEPATANATVPMPAVESPASTVTDSLPTAVDGLRALLAIQAKVRPEQIRSDETIDDLFDGVSSRRNQALLDLSREFGVSGIDGAHEIAIGRLEDELAARSGRYRYPGPYLAEHRDRSFGSLLGPSRVTRSEVTSHLASRFGVAEGWTERVGLRAMLDLRDGESVRGGALGSGAVGPANRAEALSAVEALAVAEAERTGARLEAITVTSATAVDAEVVAELEDRILGPDGPLARAAREMLGEVAAAGIEGEVSAAVEQTNSRLARLLDEFGADADAVVQP